MLTNIISNKIFLSVFNNFKFRKRLQVIYYSYIIIMFFLDLNDSLNIIENDEKS